MFSKLGACAVAAAMAVAMLAGCAELDRRGGTVAQIQDNVLFVARTKSHRLFRSYLLIGVLVAAARQGAHNQADAAAIEGNLKSALSIAYESYDCLYGYVNHGDLKNVPAKNKNIDATEWVKIATGKVGTYGAVDFYPPAICQFFDEKMARLDYALYRLALSSLLNPQSSAYLAEIRDRFVGEVPVLSASVKSAIYANKAVNQATTIVDDLLNLSFSSAGPVLTLLPLYRDSLEINMWVIVDTLTRTGNKGHPCVVPPMRPAEPEPPKIGADGSPHFALDCATRDYAYAILNNGNGYLPQWREFVRNMNPIAYEVEAYAPHFVLVSRLIWRSCNNLLVRDCDKVMQDAANIAYNEQLVVSAKPQPYSASIDPATRFARQPVRGPNRITTVPARTPLQSGDRRPPGGDSDSTGSIAPAPAAR